MYKLNFSLVAMIALVASSFVGCDTTSPLANLPGNNEVGVATIGSNNSSPEIEMLSASNDTSKVANIVHSFDELNERQWHDYDYTFNTDATLTGFTTDMKSVKLLKSNGVDIVVEIDILSKEDKEYLQGLSDHQQAMLAE